MQGDVEYAVVERCLCWMANDGANTGLGLLGWPVGEGGDCLVSRSVKPKRGPTKGGDSFVN